MNSGEKIPNPKESKTVAGGNGRAGWKFEIFNFFGVWRLVFVSRPYGRRSRPLIHDEVSCVVMTENVNR